MIINLYLFIVEKNINQFTDIRSVRNQNESIQHNIPEKLIKDKYQIRSNIHSPKHQGIYSQLIS